MPADAFRPFDIKAKPLEEGIRNWDELVQRAYDKKTVDAYSRCRVILMNGIELNATMMSHNIARLTADDEVKRVMAMIRRADSQHQQLVNWLNPADSTVIETTIAFEQVAVDLTSDLAQNEPDPYVKQALDFALLEDFDHLYRYGCLMELMLGKDPNEVTQGFTEVKPGRPTIEEHRHPDDSMRKTYDKNAAELKTKMNYFTIVSAEQETMNFYKEHGNMYEDPLARKLYTEIAEIEQQHVTQYENLGDPTETMLEKLTMMQLCEAYNYYSCAQSETDKRLKVLWEQLLEEEMGHVMACAQLLEKAEGRDLKQLLKADRIEPLIAFHPNKEYVNQILEEQVDWQANGSDKSFVPKAELPEDWPSFGYQKRVNKGEVASATVEQKVEKMGKLPAVSIIEGEKPAKGTTDIYERLHQDHEEVEAMFMQIASGKGEAAKTFDKLAIELESHSRAEEAVFYAPLKEVEEARDKVMEGYEEHHAADLFLRELRKNKAGSEQWQAKCMVLMEMVQHHVVEEEGKLFEKAKKFYDGEQAKAMVEEFERAKEEQEKKLA
jgi:rubrerythrin/hemerythrin superfamily protein